MRRLLAALLLACVCLGAPAAVPAAGRSWAHDEIRIVTSRGLMGGDPAGFRPDAPLTRAALAELVAGITGTGAQP
ncbi:MAG: S-layer homology domain-containing protein, partial [Actinomycetota bacterium]|nr:S-layer homology domain-containing protein [Actinomycetota bacterium]